MQQECSGELDVGNLHKVILYTCIQIFNGGLNIGDFIQKLLTAKVTPCQYFLAYSMLKLRPQSHITCILTQ